MDWSAFVKDIAIPVVTVLAAFVGARYGRNSAFREKMYDKQLEAYVELITAAHEVSDIISGERNAPKYQGFEHLDIAGTEDFTQEWLQLIGEKRQYLGQLRWKWSLFLTDEMDRTLGDFLNSLFFLEINIRETKFPFAVHGDNEAITNTQIAFGRVCRIARKNLGTDKLTKELSKSFGLWLWNNAKYQSMWKEGKFKTHWHDPKDKAM